LHDLKESEKLNEKEKTSLRLIIAEYERYRQALDIAMDEAEEREITIQDLEDAC